MKKILWLDLETTGLDPQSEHILEVAAIVTDHQLNILDKYHAVVHQIDPALARMNDWCRETHTKSGLLEEVRRSTLSSEQAERGLQELIVANFGNTRAILAGSSVHFDKSFISSRMPKVSKLLNYRIIDVSSFKETLRIAFEFELPKMDAKHRAMDDIKGSIEEYRQYLKMIRVSG